MNTNAADPPGQPNGKIRILVLEDDAIFRAGLLRGLGRESSDWQILEAGTIANARTHLEQAGADFIVMDILLPDGNGVDFLGELQRLAPSIRVIMTTAVPLPEYRSRAKSMGVLRFFAKPVLPKTVAAVIREFIAERNARIQDESRFTASLSNLSPLDIIQLKCLSRATQSIEFTTRNRLGIVHFQTGEIVHAETDISTGINALSEIISWRSGSVIEIPVPAPGQRTLRDNWQVLLLEASRRADEGSQSAP